MKIKPSTAANQCTALDPDCAPPIRCELEAGHEGEHQWSGTRNAPVLQEDGSYKDKEEPVLKKFDAEVPRETHGTTRGTRVPPRPSTLNPQQS